MILIYTPEITFRIEYIFKLIFSEILDVEYSILTDRDTFIQSEGECINYSNANLSGSLWIKPSGLLEEKDIKNRNPSVGKWEELPALFTNDNRSVPFDLFSAVFYLITRYEEYLDFIPDQYGRFRAEESVAFKNEFHRLPIVDLWCKKMAELLKIDIQSTKLSETNYSFRLTIDIDRPWLYKNKGLLYTAGTLLRDLFRFNFSQFTERWRIMNGNMPDPADTYNFISEVKAKLRMPVYYFILCRKKDKYDTNRSVNQKVFHRLIKRLDSMGEVGIHPSFVSATSKTKLEKEIAYLSGILNRDIKLSRQHFLRFNFPETYQNLVRLGIKEDYSMGYSSQTGFRAGTARAFNFFDLENNKETGLRIFPFQIMDRTLLSYLKLSPDKAIKEYEYYTDIIRSVGGEFVCLWHNDSISDWGEWKGWKKVFEKMINLNSDHDQVPEK